MDLEVFLWAMKMFRIKIIGPITQNSIFAHMHFLHFHQFWPTSTTHNLVISHHMDAILDFLESSRCPLHPSCWKFFHLELLSWCKMPWQKVTFCWLLKGPIMYELITPKWSIFWPWHVRHKVVENWISFKLSFGWGISDEVWESYAWSKFSWLLLKKTLI